MLKKAFATIGLALVAFFTLPAAANAAITSPPAVDSGFTVPFLMIWAGVGTLIFAVAMVFVLTNVRRQRAAALPGDLRTATA